ncbi:hypothetical protein BDR26DRAFT_900271 [Obelidium mucronatum]|nr:hypothetical protein BDR26DRAFT_900271 [Obelidium mucronatum]
MKKSLFKHSLIHSCVLDMSTRRRAPNAFMIYRAETLPLLAQQRSVEGYSLSSNELSAQVAEMWNNESEGVRRRCFAKSRSLQKQLEMVSLQQLGDYQMAKQSQQLPYNVVTTSHPANYGPVDPAGYSAYLNQRKRRSLDTSHIVQAKLPTTNSMPQTTPFMSNYSPPTYKPYQNLPQASNQLDNRVYPLSVVPPPLPQHVACGPPSFVFSYPPGPTRVQSSDAHYGNQGNSSQAYAVGFGIMASAIVPSNLKTDNMLPSMNSLVQGGQSVMSVMNLID